MRLRLGLIALLVSNACSQAATSDSPGPAPEHAAHGVAATADNAFYNLLNLSHPNYVPLSAEEMARDADVIATGSFVEVAEGMTVEYPSAKVPTALHTIVVALDVKDAVKGSKVGERIYIEFIHGGAVPAATYAARLSAEPVTVFLTPAVWFENDDVEYVGVGNGHPRGTPLYSLRTPQGFVIARDGQLLQPTAGEESLQLFNQNMDSLDDISAWYESGAPPIQQAEEAADATASGL